VTLKQAKHQVRLSPDQKEFDDELNRLIATAQATIEQEQDRIGQLGTFVWEFDQFPSCPIRLPYRNAALPVSVEYTDTSGDPQTFTDFTPALDRVYPELVPNNQAWPVAQVGFANSVKITFDAGYATLADVEADFQQAILSIVSSLFSGCEADNFGAAYQSLSNRQLATYI
jgi:hypothetical protein